MFFELKSILQRRLRQQGIGQAVAAEQATVAFRALVADQFGASAAAGLRQVALRGDTLEISAGSGALAAELRIRESEFSQALATKLGGVVYRLKIFA